MNKRQAIEEGLHFTGIYNSSKDEVKQKIAGYRIQYPKARIVLVEEPFDKLSRNYPGKGYSAYADDIYSAYETIARNKDITENHQKTIEYYKNEYEKKVAELTERYQNGLIANALIAGA
jgi:hypothetical protein